MKMPYINISILTLISILCINGQNWYLASETNNIKELFQSESSQQQEKMKRFTPMIINNHQSMTKKNNHSRTVYDNVNSDMRVFQMTHSPIITVLTSTETLKTNVINENITYLSLNNTINKRNIKNQRPKRKILRKYIRERKQKSFTSNTTTQSRFLEVFQVVEFDHFSCFSSTGLEGTCVHEYDCQKISGVAMGTCADGYGICCVIIYGCDSRSSSPIGWFINPGYPDPISERLSCTLTLDKYSNQVQQIRLDFMNFEILPPTAGTCEDDQFLITGQNVNNIIPILCGINTGQHVYLHVSESKGPISLSFQTITDEKRLFSIKVTQLLMSDYLKAPTGCLQYYRDEHGYLESFNYREKSVIGITRIPSYLNNLNYAICIERVSTSCSITYSNGGDLQLVNYDTAGLPLIPPRQAGVEIFDCPSDWLLISAVRLCGERLNDGSILQDFALDAPVTDDGMGPIVIWFRTDGIYSGRGFKLFYQQNSCIKS